jgi:predicted dehydrogenase
MNAGEWLVGPVDRLIADAEHQVLEGVHVEDTVHLLARHGTVLASYALNQYQAPNEFTLTVVFERGTARCEFHHNRWRWMETPGDTWHDESISPLERDTMFVTQAHAFLDAMEGREAPRCTLAEGWQTLRVNLAALRSLESKTWENTATP